jgi:hypothetical protein
MAALLLDRGAEVLLARGADGALANAGRARKQYAADVGII